MEMARERESVGFMGHSMVAERSLQGRVRELSSLVGELSLAMVLQCARFEAVKNRRVAPTVDDIDAAIDSVASNVPEEFADGLFAAREVLVRRLVASGT